MTHSIRRKRLKVKGERKRFLLWMSMTGKTLVMSNKKLFERRTKKYRYTEYRNQQNKSSESTQHPDKQTQMNPSTSLQYVARESLHLNKVSVVIFLFQCLILMPDKDSYQHNTRKLKANKWGKKKAQKLYKKTSSSDSTVLFSPHTKSINIVLLSYIVCQKQTKVFHKQFISSLFVFFFFCGGAKVFASSFQNFMSIQAMENQHHLRFHTTHDSSCRKRIK